MWSNSSCLQQQVRGFTMLIVLAMLGTSCGAPLVADTVRPGDQEGGTVHAGTSGTLVDNRKLSPAWIEYQTLIQRLDSDELEHIKYVNEYSMTNPNDISTPMGALCWAYHELSRSVTMGDARSTLDNYMVPALMGEYGVTGEQIGPAGPEATGAFISLLTGSDGLVGYTDTEGESQTALPGTDGEAWTVGFTGAGITDDELEFLRTWHDFAGNGTEWANAVRVVSSPEISAAFRVGKGLSKDVQVYADALQSFAKQRVGAELDLSAESEDTLYERVGFPGREAFIEAAKYHQDCKRAALDDSIGTVDSSTTTIPPVVATTTTTQTVVEEPLSSTTSITAPPSVTTTQPLVDDAIPSFSSTTVPASVVTTQPQVEDNSPPAATVPVPPVDDSVTTTTSQSSVEEPVVTTLPQVEDTSPSAATVPVPPVDGSFAATTTLPSGEDGPPPDDGGEGGLFDEDGGGG